MMRRSIYLIYMFKGHLKQTGFTIVELLVVIVVIGVLAAITVVAYTGIAQKATVASIQADLSGASSQLKMDLVINSAYPATLAAANGGRGIPSSPGTVYQYSADNTTAPPIFCVTATKDSLSYKITNDTAPVAGLCPDYGLTMRLDAGYTASYPDTGTVWSDLSGNSSNATLVNGVGFNPANGGVLSFAGASDYVSIPYGAQFNIRNAITCAIWIKRTTVFTQTQDVMLLGRPPAWYFYDSYNTGNIHGDVYIDGSRKAALDASVPFDGSWYQIVYTYDSATHMSNIYKNGAFVTSATLSGLSNYLIDASVANFAQMGSSTLGRGMLLNDARVFNRALTASDVSAMYNATRVRYGL